MRCKGCGIPLGVGESSLEYCDGFCAQCYDGIMGVNPEHRLRKK